MEVGVGQPPIRCLSGRWLGLLSCVAAFRFEVFRVFREVPGG